MNMFKVGDKVRFGEVTGIVTRADDNVYKTFEINSDGIMRFPDFWELCPLSFIVARFDGRPRPSSFPFVHTSFNSAVTEAERLSVANPGIPFDVYQAVTRSEAPKPQPNTKVL